MSASPQRSPIPGKFNRYHDDHVLQSVVSGLLPRKANQWAEQQLTLIGEGYDRAVENVAQRLDEHPPTLRHCDPCGNRIDEIDVHPLARDLKAAIFGSGFIGKYREPLATKQLGSYTETVKAAEGFMIAQLDAGQYLAAGLTDACAYAIETYGSQGQKDTLLPHLLSLNPSERWESGLYVVEKGAGSDLGAIKAIANPYQEQVQLFGEKWFCGNVGAELILVLARVDDRKPTTDGLGLFLMRRHTQEGKLNGERVLRLKSTMGLRSLPVGEVILDGAIGEPLGDVDKGFMYTVDLLNILRLHSSVAALGITRRAFAECLDWCLTRRSFGHPLSTRPMVRVALSQMAVELEAALQLVMHTALYRGRTLHGRASIQEGKLLRVLTPLVKYSTALLAQRTSARALDLLGGNGYERLAPGKVMSGRSGASCLGRFTNMMILDVFRSLRRQNTVEQFFDFIESYGSDERLVAATKELKNTISNIDLGRNPQTAWCRLWCDRAVEVLQGTLLVGAPAMSAQKLWQSII